MERSIKRKINVLGKVCKIITIVIIVLLIIAEAALLTGAVFMAVQPKDVVTVDAQGKTVITFDAERFGLNSEEMVQQANTGKIAFSGAELDTKMSAKDGTLELTVNADKIHFDLNAAINLVLVAVIKLAAAIVALCFFKGLMKAFSRCNSPFDSEVIKKMRAFAIALIPTMAVSAAANSLLGVLFGGDFFLGSIEPLPVVFALIVFILTAIFKYGARLQKEYDNTV